MFSDREAARPYRRAARCERTPRGGTPNVNEGRRQKGIAPRVEKLKQSNPNPLAHNAYATNTPSRQTRYATPQFTTPEYPHTDDMRARGPSAVRVCLGVNGSGLIIALEITKFVGGK